MRAGCLVLSCLVLGRANAQSNPEQVARDFFKAESESRWRDAAMMLDLKAFDRILQQSLSAGSHQVRNQTAEDLLRYDPQMPREVAEYQARKANEAYVDFNFVEREYAGVDSLPALRNLSVADAAARWLQARGPEWQRELAFRQAKKHPTPGCRAPLDSIKAGPPPQMKWPTARIIGTVAAQDSVAYVLVGLDDPATSRARRYGSDEFFTPAVLILYRVAGSWKIFPVGDMPQSTGVRPMGFVIDCGEVVPVRSTSGH